MKYTYRFGVVIVLCLALGLLYGSASAQGRPYFHFTDLSGIGCDSQQTRVRYEGYNFDNDSQYDIEGWVIGDGEIYEHTVQSVPGSAFSTNWLWQAEDYNTGGGQTATFPLPPDTPFFIRVIVFTDAERTEGWVAEAYLDKCNGGTIVQRLDYPYVLPTSVVENNGGVLFLDGRINNNDPAAPVIVYGHDFDDGRGLVMYAPNDREVLIVTPEQIAEVPDCPSSNTLIASNLAEGIALYRLNTCEYQVNALTIEGKTYILIFDALYPMGYQSYEMWME